MAVAVVASATASDTTGGTSLTISTPTGTLSGHVMIAQIVCLATVSSMTAPAGWTSITSSTGGAVDEYLYYRVCDGTEGASYQWTWTNTSKSLGAIVTYSGVAATVVDGSVTTFNGSSTTVSCTAITPNARWYHVMAFMASAYGNGDITPGNGLTADVSYNTAGAATGNLVIARKWFDIVSTTGSNAGTIASAAAGVGITMCLVPDTSACPQFRANAVANAGSSPITVNKPAGTTDGDLMVAVISFAANAGTITVPSGWTLAASTNSASNRRTFIYTKTAASEGASYQWSWTNASTCEGGITSWYNVDTSTPYEAASVVNSASATGTTITVPDVTTTVDNCIELSLFDAAGTSAIGATTGQTSRSAQNNANGSDKQSSEPRQYAGATGTRTASCGNSLWTGGQIIIRPYVSSGTIGNQYFWSL